MRLPEKRTIILLVTLVLCSALLASCHHSGNGEAESPADTAPPVVQETTEAQQPINLSSFEERAYSIGGDYPGTFTEVHRLFEDLLVDVGISAGVCGDEARAVSLIEGLLADVRRLRECIPDGSVLTVHILDVAAGVYPSDLKSELFCTADSMGGEAYRADLVEAMYGISEYWANAGLSLLAFDDADDFDGVDLSAWYGERGLGMLDLFGARFFTDWVDEDELQMARATARALVRFVIGNYPVDVLQNRLPAEIKQDWLRSIGLDVEYYDPDEAYLADMTFNVGLNAQIEIGYDNYIYNIYNLDYGSDVYDLMTADDLKEFFINERRGKQLIIDYLYENLQDYAPAIIESESAQKITYSISMRGGVSVVTGRHIDLITTADSWCEWSRVLLWQSPVRLASGSWAEEGLCEYLGRIVADDQYGKADLYNAIVENDYNKQLFLAAGAMLASLGEFDVRIAYDIMALNQYNNPSPVAAGTIGRVNGKRLPYEGGDELTFYQAQSLMHFLVDNYSFADAFALLSGRTFDYNGIFGKSYEELKQDWLDWMMDRYADYYDYIEQASNEQNSD